MTSDKRELLATTAHVEELMAPAALDPNEPLWDDCQAAEFMRLSPGTLRKARMSGSGPPFLKIGHRVRYVPRLLAEWCASACSTFDRRTARS